MWSCHRGHKLLCKLRRTFPPPVIKARFTVFLASQPCGPAGWLTLLLTKAGDVETNPGPNTLNKLVWICDICYKQIHVRKQISIRCNMIDHWVHLRCAGIRQAQYTQGYRPSSKTERNLIIRNQKQTLGAQITYSRHTCIYHHNSGNQTHP